MESAIQMESQQDNRTHRANRIKANSQQNSQNSQNSPNSQNSQNSLPQKRVRIQADVTAEPHIKHPQKHNDEHKDGIYNFCLPSEEEIKQTPEENLESSSAGLKSSRTGGAWHKSLEESHSAQVKEKSLLGHLQCSGETQKQILESDIFHILSSEGVTGIGALYKVSPSKFVLVFRSQTEKEKLKNTVIPSRFGESDICLNFSKRGGPLRDGKEPILVTINLPEYVSDQAVELAFSNFGEVVYLQRQAQI